MSHRLLLGLALGSGCEGIDAAVVRIHGAGLSAQPTIEHTARTPLLPTVRESLLNGTVATRELGDAISTAARHLVTKSQIDLRSILVAGIHLPGNVPFDSIGETVAEQIGLTVWCRFADRDRSAGGMGRPWTPAADYLAAGSATEDRVLIHLGQIASVLSIPAQCKITELVAWDAVPCGQLLDALVRRGTRDRDRIDPGGTRAVQGKCHDELIADWMTHPHFSRRPPKHLSNEFGAGFVKVAFETARDHQASLADLLCTVTHFISRAIRLSVQQYLPPPTRPRSVYVSGGGVRNGFLWQLLQQQFRDESVRRTDDIGLPALGRNAVAAAILAGLTLDGVAANLPLLTGASGGRLVGRFIPGDPRNWAAVTAWAAEQMWEYSQLRVA